MLRAAVPGDDLRCARLALICSGASQLHGARAILFHAPATGKGIGKRHLGRRIAAPGRPKEPGRGNSIILRTPLAIGGHCAKQRFGCRNPALGKLAEQTAGFDMIAAVEGRKPRIHQLISGHWRIQPNLGASGREGRGRDGRGSDGRGSDGRGRKTG